MDLSPDRLLSIFKRGGARPVALSEVLDEIGAPRSQRQVVLSALGALVGEGRLVRLRKQYFTLPSRARRVRGEIHVSSRGKGFLLGAASDGSDLYIHNTNLGSAIDGDTVEAEIVQGRREGDEGRVVEIVERAHAFVVGRFTRRGPSGGIVAPRNAKIGHAIEIVDAPPREKLPGGAWVRVRVTQWPDSAGELLPVDEPLLAEIVEVLGMPGERGVSVLALLRDLGVELEFPGEALREAERFESPASEKEIARRLDLRQSAILTIDPATAKDFDDALSIETLPDRAWRLGVHIADVAQYVAADSALDAEARRRATSIYPVDRVVPMLPERLSNDLCSLRPDEDRYALSCIMKINAQGEVLEYEVAESVIRSARRLNYGEVQEFFDADATARAAMPAAGVGAELLALRDLARALTDMRFQRGALDLDLPETKIECDADGNTLDVKRYDRFESNRLVEECMLIANETVARHFQKNHLPCLYRIHDLPDPASLERMGPILALFGVRVPKNPTPSPDVYQPIIERLHLVDGGHVGQRLLLRTLMRAEYSPENRGHFGLASRCYCHFTSPIRRYPDLLVHRSLKAWLRGETDDAEWIEREAQALPAIANHCNLEAEKAESIEREATKVKAMEFMKDRIGASFEGWITGITRRGFFVELVDYPVEGYVDGRTIEGDQYQADELRTRLVGRFTRVSYRLGQRVRVRVVRASETDGEMDLQLLQNASAAGGKKKRKGSGK